MNQRANRLAQLPGVGSRACWVNGKGYKSLISLENEWRESSGVEGGGANFFDQPGELSMQKPHLLCSAGYHNIHISICSFLFPLCLFRGKVPRTPSEEKRRNDVFRMGRGGGKNRIQACLDLHQENTEGYTRG